MRSSTKSTPIVMSNSNASRILLVKNLNPKTRGDDIFELFSRHGSIRQTRIGNGPKTRGPLLDLSFALLGRSGRTGTAFVVYEDLNDAKTAFEHLNGFHLQERESRSSSLSKRQTDRAAQYIVLLYFSAQKQQEKDLARREAELEALKAKHKISEEA